MKGASEMSRQWKRFAAILAVENPQGKDARQRLVEYLMCKNGADYRAFVERWF